MTTSGQSRKDLRRPKKRDHRGRRGSQPSLIGAEVSAAVMPGLPKVNLRKTVRVGSWNVRTLRSDDAIWQLSEELRRLRLSVAALSEVRRPGEGQISVGGYTYFWSGSRTGAHFGGVAIAVADALLPAIDNICYVSDRLMSLRLRHNTGVLTVVSVYAPTNVGREEDKILFYRQLRSVAESCPARDTLLVMGDFNAEVGSSRAGYEHVVGPHGKGVRNDNGSRLLEFARSKSLRVAGTWYQRSDYHRWTWYSNTGTCVKEIDHVLVGTRWRLLRNCRVFRSAQFDTDHRLLVAELQLKIRSTRRSSRRPVFDVGKLRDEKVQLEFRRHFLGSAAVAGPESSSGWETFRERLTSAARDTLGFAVPQRRSWRLPAEVVNLINRQRRARLNGEKALYQSLRGQVASALRVAEEARVGEICGRVSKHLFTCNSGPAFAAISDLSGKQRPSRPSTILSEDGSVLEGHRALGRLAGYFEELLKVKPPARAIDTSELTPLTADPPIDTQPPDLIEVRAAVSRLKSGRAAGVCNIPAELLKAGGDTVLRELVAVFGNIWKTCDIPPEWRRSIIVPLYKGKGDRRDCGNYRGISLLSVPGKIFARVLLDRIRPHLIQHQRPEQSGFTPKKSTVDRILALRVLIERRREFRKSFIGAYVDFRKAFDSVHRETLWGLLRFRGIPEELLRLIRALYSGTESAVRHSGETSEYFLVTEGVRQGCVLAPSLFGVCMDWIMGRTVDQGFRGASFGEVGFTDLDFADDAVIFAETMRDLVLFLEALAREAECLGLHVSWMKTKIQHFIQAVDQVCSTVTCCGEQVQVVDSFPYLGSRVSSDGKSDEDITRRLGLAWGAMSALGVRVWRSRHLSRMTKVEVFKRLVLPVLLYGCETWTLTEKLRARLDAFGTINLRRILGYKWYDFIPNKQVLQESSMINISKLVLERQKSMFGHVARFPNGDPAHQILSCGNPPLWKRGRGRPPHTWLKQMDGYFAGVGTTRERAWALAKGDPEAFRALGKPQQSV